MSFCKTALFLFTVLLFMSVLAHAFPHGCEITGFSFSQNNLIVNDSETQSFYLVHNLSDSQIKLQRYDNHKAFMSPPLIAKIDSSNWAAFASDVANLNFQCFVHENEADLPIDCQNVLEVCRYPRVKFALSNMGNYWVSTNKTQNEVLNEATKKGILLRW